MREEKTKRTTKEEYGKYGGERGHDKYTPIHMPSEPLSDRFNCQEMGAIARRDWVPVRRPCTATQATSWIHSDDTSSDPPGNFSVDED